ncbi:MAG: hypothetical protein JSS69_03710 [Acidobacteria bacterium]|nr:hypothetical protein [Acidobacteriota bacterium]MBS1865000.1 hypothetical protein [Acidobacteriota bacterium]
MNRVTTKMIVSIPKTFFAAVALCCFATILSAQEPDAPPPQVPAPDATPAKTPKPAGRGVPSLDPNDAQDQNPDKDWRPDTMPITGLQSPTVGNQDLRHSYFVPGFQYTSTIQNQQLGATTPSTGGWYANHFLGANFSLVQQWVRSEFTVNYSGGGFLTSDSGQNNGWYQQLALSQSFNWRRWQMQILDQFSYLPESQFGFGAGTGLGLPGISGPLGPTTPPIVGSVSPNQNNFAAIGPQYNNSTVAQLTYQLSPRGSITVGGSYGLSRYTQAGNINSNIYVGNLGYNYQLTKEDSIGVFYRFSAYHFDNSSRPVGDQVINFVYERRITRKIALQLEGGPDIVNRTDLLGVKQRSVSASGGANLRYSFRRGDVSAAYSHGVSSGGGLLTGATMDQVTFSASKSIGRAWSLQANSGFARNSALSNSGATLATNFNSIFAGGGISRAIGRDTNFSLAYQARIQQQNLTNCSGPSCSSSYTQSSIVINLQWHTRPFVLR